MNVGIHHQIRIAKISIAICLVGSGLALAGCSAAPAGATYDSPAVGPVRTGAAAVNFAPFPVPSKWTGAGGSDYTAITKAKTGTTPREFTLTAASSLVFWLGCIGTGSNTGPVTGTARLVGPSIGLNWSVPCGSGGYPAGVTFTPPPATVGTSVKVEVTSPPGTRWEFRADGKDDPGKKA